MPDFKDEDVFRPMWEDESPKNFPSDPQKRRDMVRRHFRSVCPVWMAVAWLRTAARRCINDDKLTSIDSFATYWAAREGSKSRICARAVQLNMSVLRPLAKEGTLLRSMDEVVRWCLGPGAGSPDVQAVVLQMFPEQLRSLLLEPTGDQLIPGPSKWDSIVTLWNERLALATGPAAAPPTPFHSRLEKNKTGKATAPPVVVWDADWPVTGRVHGMILKMSQPLESNANTLARSEIQINLLRTMSRAEKDARRRRCYQCGKQGVMMGHPGCSKAASSKAFHIAPYVCFLCHDSVSKSQARKKFPRCESCRRQVCVPARSGHVVVPAWKTSDQEQLVRLVVDERPVDACCDSGQDFSSVHVDLVSDWTTTADDDDLRQMAAMGLVGADGSGLRLPSAVIKGSLVRFAEVETVYRMKWFVVAHGRVAWTIGRNLLDSRRDREAKAPLQAGAARVEPPERGGELELEAVLARGRWGEKLERAGMVRNACFKIDLIDGAEPSMCVSRVHRNFTWEEKEAQSKYVRQGLECGLFRHSNSPANSHIVMEQQPGKIRTCIAYNLVNALTKESVQNIPNVNEVLASFQESLLQATAANGGVPPEVLVSVLDMTNGYGQIGMHEDSIPFSAFTTHDGMHVECKDGCTFGLKGLPQYYNRVMAAALRDWGVQDHVKSVFDDLLVMTFAGVQDHLRILGALMDGIRRDGWTVKRSKSQLLVKNFVFSGAEVDVSSGSIVISPNPKVISQIAGIKIPSNARESRSFASLVSTISKYVPRLEEHRAYFAKRIKDQRQGTTVVWTDEEHERWRSMVDAICNSRAIREPVPGARTYFFMDASLVAECIMAYQGEAVWEIDLDGQFCLDWDKSELFLVGCVSRAFRGGCQEDWQPWRKEAHCFSLLADRFGHITSCPSRAGERHVVLIDSEICEKMFHAKFIEDSAARAWMAKAAGMHIDVHWIPSADNVADPGTRALFGHDLSHLDKSNPLLREGASARIVGPVRINTGLVAAGASVGAQKSVLEWIADAHDSTEAGHGQYQSTWFRMQQSGFVGPEPKQEIADFIKSCTTCQKAKKGGGLRPPLKLVEVPETPWSQIHMDLKVMNSTDANGFKYILAVVDASTSAVVLAPLKRKRSSDVSRAVRERVVAYYGFPSFWSSDNGGEFINDELCGWFESHGAKRIDILPYEPQGNGKVERVMGMVGKRLLCLPDAEKKEWSTRVPEMMLGINTALFTPTGHSRAAALMGFQPKTSSVVGRDRDSQVQEMRSVLRERYINDKVAVKDAFDRRNHVEEVSVAVGDLVLSEVRDRDKKDKLALNWEGPFVVRSVSDLHVELSGSADSPPDTFKKVHVRRLKPFNARAEATEPRSLAASLEPIAVDEVNVVDVASGQPGQPIPDETVGSSFPVGEFGREPVRLIWDDDTIQSVRNLKEAKESSRTRNAQRMITLSHRDVDLVDQVKDHRLNSDQGFWEFLVSWKEGNADMWVPAAEGTDFCKPLQEYIFSLEGDEQDPKLL